MSKKRLMFLASVPAFILILGFILIIQKNRLNNETKSDLILQIGDFRVYQEQFEELMNRGNQKCSETEVFDNLISSGLLYNYAFTEGYIDKETLGEGISLLQKEVTIKHAGKNKKNKYELSDSAYSADVCIIKNPKGKDLIELKNLCDNAEWLRKHINSSDMFLERKVFTGNDLSCKISERINRVLKKDGSGIFKINDGIYYLRHKGAIKKKKEFIYDNEIKKTFENPSVNSEILSGIDFSINPIVNVSQNDSIICQLFDIDYKVNDLHTDLKRLTQEQKQLIYDKKTRTNTVVKLFLLKAYNMNKKQFHPVNMVEQKRLAESELKTTFVKYGMNDSAIACLSKWMQIRTEKAENQTYTCVLEKDMALILEQVSNIELEKWPDFEFVKINHNLISSLKLINISKDELIAHTPITKTYMKDVKDLLNSLTAQTIRELVKGNNIEKLIVYYYNSVNYPTDQIIFNETAIDKIRIVFKNSLYQETDDSVVIGRFKGQTYSVGWIRKRIGNSILFNRKKKNIYSNIKSFTEKSILDDFAYKNLSDEPNLDQLKINMEAEKLQQHYILEKVYFNELGNLLDFSFNRLEYDILWHKAVKKYMFVKYEQIIQQSLKEDISHIYVNESKLRDIEIDVTQSKYKQYLCPLIR